MTVVFKLAERLQLAGAAEELLLIIVKATLILLVARLMIAAMPRASAATRHLIATAGLIAALLLPAAAALTPVWQVAIRGAESEAPRKTIGVTDQEEESSTLSTAISLARATGVVPESPLSAVDRFSRVIGMTWKGWIVLWTVVPGALMLLHMLAGIAGVWHVTRHSRTWDGVEANEVLEGARQQLGIRQRVRLLLSERIAVPVVWGTAEPVLLLPPDASTWSADRLRVVLLHELAHLRRYDGVTLIASRAAVALFWFHPLAWSLERAARSECERACDDLVLAGGTRPSEYADHLLAIARSMPAFDPFRTVTLAMSRKSQLEGRLLSILQPQVVRRVLGRRGVAVAAVIAVAIVAPLAALRIVAAPASARQVAEDNRTNSSSTPASGTSLDVTPELDALSDYVLAGIGHASGNEALSFTPKTGHAWHERAFKLYRSDRYEEAAAGFEKAAELGYDRARAMYNAACSYALLGDADRALPALERALAAGWDDMERIGKDSDFDPIRNDPRFARLLRDDAVATNRLTRTVKRFEALRAPSPAGGSSEATTASGKEWMSVGLDLLRLRRTEDAIHAFQQALAAHHMTATASYNIACAYSLSGDTANGILWLDRAIENGFSSSSKLKNDPDITILRADGRFPALLAKAKDFEMRGEYDGPWQIFDMGPDWAAAKAHHQRVAARYPRSGRAWFNLGYTALQARDFATAQDALRRTIALDYRVGTCAYNMACAAALQGRRDEAFEWLERSRAAGFALDEHIKDDDDLKSLHGDPRWDRLMAEARREKLTKVKARVKRGAEAAYAYAYEVEDGVIRHQVIEHHGDEHAKKQTTVSVHVNP